MANKTLEEFHLLEEKIGYSFKNKALLIKAMTHSSFSSESKTPVECNERLEFLGDSVLKFILSETLYTDYPELPEGMLSKIRSRSEDKEALSAFSSEIGIGQFVLLGKGEEKQNGRTKPKILEDAFESLIGAMYLDSDIPTVKNFILPLIDKKIKTVVESGNIEDYKTKLQHIIQNEKGDELKYEVVGKKGPDNAPEYEVRVLINSMPYGKGKGQNRKEAEQNAAKEALVYFNTEACFDKKDGGDKQK